MVNNNFTVYCFNPMCRVEYQLRKHVTLTEHRFNTGPPAYDADPALNQHRSDVSCLLWTGVHVFIDPYSDLSPVFSVGIPLVLRTWSVTPATAPLTWIQSLAQYPHLGPVLSTFSLVFFFIKSSLISCCRLQEYKMLVCNRRTSPFFSLAGI